MTGIGSGGIVPTARSLIVRAAKAPGEPGGSRRPPTTEALGQISPPARKRLRYHGADAVGRARARPAAAIAAISSTARVGVARAPQARCPDAPMQVPAMSSLSSTRRSGAAALPHRRQRAGEQDVRRAGRPGAQCRSRWSQRSARSAISPAPPHQRSARRHGAHPRAPRQRGGMCHGGTAGFTLDSAEPKRRTARRAPPTARRARPSFVPPRQSLLAEASASQRAAQASSAARPGRVTTAARARRR